MKEECSVNLTLTRKRKTTSNLFGKSEQMYGTLSIRKAVAVCKGIKTDKTTKRRCEENEEKDGEKGSLSELTNEKRVP